ncbi:MAG: hypothetical protein ACOX7Q_08725 [Kiritimatiellia bacterium]
MPSRPNTPSLRCASSTSSTRQRRISTPQRWVPDWVPSDARFLGTVPVEADGSAYFEAPANMPLYFQALDAKGRAVQTMRSAVYLQPGEHESCVAAMRIAARATCPRNPRWPHNARRLSFSPRSRDASVQLPQTLSARVGPQVRDVPRREA